jgi:hypothetical protein
LAEQAAALSAGSAGLGAGDSTALAEALEELHAARAVLSSERQSHHAAQMQLRQLALELAEVTAPHPNR